MRKRMRRVVDLLAVLLLLALLLATVAFLGYDAAHPPNSFLGEIGAAVAHDLTGMFGSAVPVFLGAWFIFVLTLLLEGRRGVWCWRLLGWLLLVPGLALSVDVFVGAGLGGVLGTSLHQLAAAHVTNWGVALIGVAGVTGGGGLAGDFFWPGFFARLNGAFRRWRESRAQRRTEALRKRIEADKVKAPLVREVFPQSPALGKNADAAPAPVQAAEPVETSVAPVQSAIRSPQSAIPEPPPIVRPQPPAVSHGIVMPAETPINDYQLPPFDLLMDPEPFPYEAHDQQLRDRAVKLEKTFTDFGLNIRVVGINTGPVITQYEVALETGLRVHKVTRLADDIALNLKVPSVRMVAPIPNKDTVGIEIPNEQRAVVRLKETILNGGPRVAKMKIPLFLGKDTEGRPLVYDLADMPHLLIAGRTGTGKSVCMNAIILSMLMTRRPDEVKMIMIDPKMLELSEYGKIPHLMHPVVKDMKKAEAILAWAVDKMEERYDLLSRARVRSIAGYNELSPEEIYRRVRPVDDDEKARIPERMPYIVIFIDEMNDLMMTMKKEVEGHVIRLAQKSRAAGIHLIVATQKPTVDVITGLIKSNLPARICFQVSSRTDSRVVLDEMGAEKLLGKGDMLFLQPGTSTIIRAQGTYASDREITNVVEFLECEPAWSRELIQVSTSAKDCKPGEQGGLKARDELYEQAIEVIVREGRGSVSLLQRAMGIGYGRAARLIDYMAEDGIVGGYNGANAREVLLTPEQWEQMKQNGRGADAA